ncbi:MAG: SidA/IucD/PvdA family monooxygenase [Azospirillaceae bacterium]
MAERLTRAATSPSPSGPAPTGTVGPRPPADETGEVRVDCLGIGFGPANIAVAVAMEEAGFDGSVLFLESRTGPDWQPDMLLEGTDIQNNPLRDFVTPRNPRSPYGFLSYLQAEGRLFDYLNLDVHYPPRTEFARYVRWVARHFDPIVSYGERAVDMTPTTGEDGRPEVVVTTGLGRRIRARSLVFAPGRSPLIPAIFQGIDDDRIAHLTRYLTAVSRWRHEGRLGRVAVIGASQSAVEIVLDLTRRSPGTRIENIFRSFSYKLKDTSPFTEEIYFPGFVDYYHGMSEDAQRALSEELWRSNYGAADHDVISALHNLLYEQRLTGRQTVTLHSGRDIVGVEPGEDGIGLDIAPRYGAGGPERLTVDAVLLATGFLNFGTGPGREPWHPLLDGIAPHCAKRGDGSLSVSRDFRVHPAPGAPDLPPILLNGVCESTHGFGDAGSISLLSVRSWTILNALLDDAPATPAAAAVG